MLRELFWQILAWIVSRETVADWIIERATRTPYKHIYGRGGDMYMARWWFFNPQPEDDAHDDRPLWRRLFPSVRVHWIRRADEDRHNHDHPREARTCVMRNWYREVRQQGGLGGFTGPQFLRKRGFTGRLRFGEFHRITQVAPDGAWTLFFTWKKQAEWGFDVNGVKVPWKEYLGVTA